MSFILGEAGQLHFQHAHWNGNVKSGVSRLKVKRNMGIKNTLLQSEKENFSQNKKKGRKVNLFGPESLNPQIWVINWGEGTSKDEGV